MDIVQEFYDNLAPQYENLFDDWRKETFYQGVMLLGILRKYGIDPPKTVLDCACGIGTQALGISRFTFDVIGSDISEVSLEKARRIAKIFKCPVTFQKADFRKLSDTFKQKFDIIIAMDNALPHMLTEEDMEMAIASITDRLNDDGVFVASIRDYDEILKTKPPYSPPYIYGREGNRQISFQTWDWKGDRYKLTQYIINDEDTLEISKYNCEYRAVKREEITNLFYKYGYSKVDWLFPKYTNFYQPIVIAKK
ncbi:MAG: methyltransferase domain-containing protein [Ruminococcaceae bacterium]|nr:methyltransferase domain-containing protein [Oscillospiraceae bacterium]